MPPCEVSPVFSPPPPPLLLLLLLFLLLPLLLLPLLPLLLLPLLPLLLLFLYPYYRSTISYLLIFSSLFNFYSLSSTSLLPPSPFCLLFFSLFPLLTFLIHPPPSTTFSYSPSILSHLYYPPSPPLTSTIGLLLLDFSSLTPLRPATGATPRPGEGDILEGRPHLS